MNYWCSCLSILPIYVFEAELIGVGGEEGENGRTNEVKRTGRKEGLSVKLVTQKEFLRNE